MKNTCNKERKRGNPYEVWGSKDGIGDDSAGTWRWEVLKKWQADDDKPYARWFCDVYSPFVPDGEMGDVYVKEIKENAILVHTNYDK